MSKNDFKVKIHPKQIVIVMQILNVLLMCLKEVDINSEEGVAMNDFKKRTSNART